MELSAERRPLSACHRVTAPGWSPPSSRGFRIGRLSRTAATAENRLRCTDVLFYGEDVPRTEGPDARGLSWTKGDTVEIELADTVAALPDEPLQAAARGASQDLAFTVPGPRP